MKRLLLTVSLVLAGCSQFPPGADSRAAVETRPAGDPRSVSPGRTVAPARAGAENPSIAYKKDAARSETAEPSKAELLRTIDRQSRRIVELESRAGDAESRQAVDLVAYFQRMATLHSEEQAHLLAAANQEYARDSGPYSRLRLALTLATPGTAFNDDARAAALLDPLVANASTKGPLKQLAVLVHGLISERVRDQKRVAQLKEQLDGLRAIDRALIDREQGKAP